MYVNLLLCVRRSRIATIPKLARGFNPLLKNINTSLSASFCPQYKLLRAILPKHNDAQHFV